MNIKYRIYDNKYSEYIEEADWAWSISRSGMIYDSRNDEWSKIGERYAVEFYTGCKDSNGKEIYEGDIDSYGCRVIYHYSGFSLAKGDQIIPLQATTHITITGNIHDNDKPTEQ